MVRWSALLFGALGFVLAAAAAWSLSPGFAGLTFTEVERDRISVAMADFYLLSSRIDDNGRGAAADSEEAEVSGPIQISAAWSKAKSDQPAALFATGLSDDTRIFANGVPAGSPHEFGFRPIGLGSAWAYVPLDLRSHVTALERADFVVPAGTDGAGGFRLWSVKNQPNSNFATAYAFATERMRLAIQTSNWIGLISAVIGLLLSQHLRLFAGGTIVVLAGLAQSGWSESLFDLVMRDLAFALATLLGIGLMMSARSRSSRWLQEFLFGLILCAGLGSLIALANATGIHPSLAQIHFANLAAIPLIALGLPLMLLGAARETISALVTARRAVAQRDAIIGEQEAELQDQVRKQAVLEERQRFVRDMHDGVGGQLLNLLVKVRGRQVALGDVESEIERSIADLRLVVDSLDHVGNDLATALESFRGRTSVQLAGGGIALDWHEEGPISEWTFSARQVLSIYRIMQEAIGNAVRHADASGIDVRVAAGCPDKGMLGIVISDDGRGFDQSAVQAGRGLGNMRNRAERLGGELSIETAPGDGTQITLSLAPANFSD